AREAGEIPRFAHELAAGRVVGVQVLRVLREDRARGVLAQEPREALAVLGRDRDARVGELEVPAPGEPEQAGRRRRLPLPPRAPASRWEGGPRVPTPPRVRSSPPTRLPASTRRRIVPPSEISASSG